MGQARARLTRMERQVTLRAGRATRVRRDLASWSKDDRRALMPTLDVSGEEKRVLLYPREWLQAFAALKDPDAKESKAGLSQLYALWPWESVSHKDINGKVADSEPETAADCVGAFIKVLWRCCE